MLFWLNTEGFDEASSGISAFSLGFFCVARITEYGQREIGKEKSGSSCLTEAVIRKENQVVESYQQMENIQQRWYHRNYPMMKWESYRK